MTLATFLTIALIHLAAAISPGPSFVVSVRTAATEGFGTAAALAVGFGLGAVLWALAAMAGLALLFEILPSAFLALRIAGAAFLLWIAYQMWRHAPDPLPATAADAPPRSALSAMRFGFLTFAANPKTAVFFGAVVVGLLPAEASLGARAALLAVIFANETVWYLIVARLFSLPSARAAYARAKAPVDRLFGAILAALGLKIAIG